MAIGDKIKWRGVQPTDPEAIFTFREPPEGCTYVSAFATVSDSAGAIYTVPGNKKFYLTDMLATGYCLAAGLIGTISVKSGAHAITRRLMYCSYPANYILHIERSWVIAEQLPPTYYVHASSNSASLVFYVSIWGYTRDA